MSWLDLLFCPFCGGTLTLENAESEFGKVQFGLLKCLCGSYPILAGIPILKKKLPFGVLNLTEARQHREALVRMLLPPIPSSWFWKAGRALSSVKPTRPLGGRIARWLEGEWRARTERELVSAESFEEALDLVFRCSGWGNPETFNYFFYRRSDPTFLVGLAMLACLEPHAGPILDLGCGAGHYARTFTQARLGSLVVGMDEKFVLLYLAKRFIAPDGEFVCASAERPLPFRDGSFNGAFCADAFFDIEAQGNCARELMRVTAPEGVVLLPHLHNPAVPSPYRGHLPLPPGVCRELFAPFSPRLFSERAILGDYLADRFLDLTQEASDDALADEPSFALVGTRRRGFFRKCPTFQEPFRGEELRANPIYQWNRSRERWTGTLALPSEAYLREYPALQEYLPREVTIPANFAGRSFEDPELRELVRRRVLLPLPACYARDLGW